MGDVKMRRRNRLATAGLVTIVAAAMAWSTYGKGADAPATETRSGYLEPELVPDPRIVLPLAPLDQSVAGEADLAIFHETRAAVGSERWQLAARDNAADHAGLLRAFGCALGAEVRPGDAPKLDELMRRATADALLVIRRAKELNQRARPFSRGEGEICVPRTPELSHNDSYPSGHATVGWLYGLILGEVAPDRASELLGRGRAYGDSRIICGVHFASDIDAGRTAAAAVVSVLHSDARFRSDMEAAQAELAALRSRAPTPDPAQCAIERSAIAQTPGF